MYLFGLQLLTVKVFVSFEKLSLADPEGGGTYEFFGKRLTPI